MICLIPYSILSFENKTEGDIMETVDQNTETVAVSKKINPEHILKIGMGFFASKTLLAAVNMGLFTQLALRSQTALEIKETLGLHRRSYLDFLDSLVALGFLEREGTDSEAIYSCTEETEIFLDKNKPSYLGGILEMGNNRLFKYWNDLEDGLKTGLPQNELKYKRTENIFEGIYSNFESLNEFLRAMSGVQAGAFISFAKQFDFSGYSTFCDAGGGNGSLCIQVALQNPHMSCVNFDLPQVEEVAHATIEDSGLSEKIKTTGGDFFRDPLPESDVIAMGNILHDWSKEERLILMKKVYNALPPGGAFVCIEDIIDNRRRENAFGLLMSLNMLIETKAGANFTFNDFDEMAHRSGFSKTDWMPLAGPSSAAIAYK